MWSWFLYWSELHSLRRQRIVHWLSRSYICASRLLGAPSLVYALLMRFYRVDGFLLCFGMHRLLPGSSHHVTVALPIAVVSMVSLVRFLPWANREMSTNFGHKITAHTSMAHIQARHSPINKRRATAGNSQTRNSNRCLQETNFPSPQILIILSSGKSGCSSITQFLLGGISPPALRATVLAKKKT